MPSYFMETAQPTMWDPVEIFSTQLPEDKRYGLVVLNQPLEASYYTRIWSNAIWVVAADGGATRVHELNQRIACQDIDPNKPALHVDTIIGDLDSLGKENKLYWVSKGAEIVKISDQESTDFTKAVKYLKTFEVPEEAECKISSNQERRAVRTIVAANKPRTIVTLGGLGGRVDQGMSVLHHIFMFQGDDPSSKIYLLSREAITFVLRPGVHMIKAKGGDNGVKLGQHVGIVPLKGPSIITTKGLKWDVENWATHIGGQISTSNLVGEYEMVTVVTTNDVLFTINIDA